MASLSQKIASDQAVIGLIGMGFIGLSLLEVFGDKGFPLVGYDLNTQRVEMLKRAEAYYNFMPVKKLHAWIEKKQFTPSSDPDILNSADVLIISVPTSLDHHRLPDLSSLKGAFTTAASHLKKGQLIILQSTTYPGTTEKEFLPILEARGLKVGKDFFLGYVPEISDPGNPDYSFTNVPRIVSGITPACRDLVEQLYKKIGCKVIPCPSTQVAEAAKILQNTYRLVNISLVNEMKIMFDRMGMDIWEVIEAASTKPFGFTPFYPGPGIGGDCIPVVPFYLSWKAQETDGPSSLIDLAGSINLSMPHYVVEKVTEALSARKKSLAGAKILMLGVSYKKDVNDLRESPSLRILTLLKEKKAEVFYHDPLVPVLDKLRYYPDLHLKSVELDYKKWGAYDAILIATDHSCYNWKEIVAHAALIIDTRNVTKGLADPEHKITKA
ncbi:MAG: nucleotide sugar dehydrogenase [Chlamydiae bacterium]|nr:nucleotide sugar dehydrogenase [Chlamydiota bacterium]